MIKRYWHLIAARVDEMALRQRAMLFASVSLALIALAHVAFIEPLLVKQKSLIERSKRDQSQLAAVRAQIESVLKEQQRDPEQAALRALEQQVADAAQALAARKQAFAAGTRLPTLLRDLLAKGQRVKLETLRVLPGAPVEGSQFYRHGLEITLTGGYFDLLQYLTELEKLPAKFLWGSGTLQVEQYPAVSLTLQIYTLTGEPALGL